MATYLSLAAGYGIKDLGHTMADIVTHDLAYKESCYEYTYHRIYQIEPVESMWVETTCKQVLDKMYEMMQQKGCKGRKDTDGKAQYQYELVMRDMLFAPLYEAVKQALFVLSFHHSLIIVTVPFSVSLIMLEDFALPFSSCL